MTTGPKRAAGLPTTGRNRRPSSQPLIAKKSATLSDCGLYRYSLTREFDPSSQNKRTAVMVMLNPSRADAERDDATLTRCINYARDDWGCGVLVVVNLYAYRCTDPAKLWQAADPVGPDNDAYLREAATRARETEGPLVAAWGNHARRDRVDEVLAIPGMQPLTALAVTKPGNPHHPLRLNRHLSPGPWSPRA